MKQSDTVFSVNFMSHGTGANEGASERVLAAAVLAVFIRKENIADHMTDGALRLFVESMATAVTVALCGIRNRFWLN